MRIKTIVTIIMTLLPLFILLCLISWLFYFLWPNDSLLNKNTLNNQLNTIPLTLNSTQTLATEHQPPVEQLSSPNSQLKHSSSHSVNVTASHLQQDNNDQSSSPTIIEIDTIEALTGKLTDLIDNKHNADDKKKLAYYLALAQCSEFYRYASAKGQLEIPRQEIKQTEQELESSRATQNKKQQKMDNCQSLASDELEGMYDAVATLAIESEHPQVSIQAMLLLSHLPNLKKPTNQTATQSATLEHHQKQLMWLEQARQQGSLNALLNLAVRYQYGSSPDPAAAAAYYQTLQQLAPEYQFTETVTELTQNLKTWQKEEVETNSQILTDEMQRLQYLYTW